MSSGIQSRALNLSYTTMTSWLARNSIGENCHSRYKKSTS